MYDREEPHTMGPSQRIAARGHLKDEAEIGELHRKRCEHLGRAANVDRGLDGQCR
jgi:hypothetical protein